MFLIFLQIMIMEVYQILQLNVLAVVTIAHFCALQSSIFQVFLVLQPVLQPQAVSSMMDSDAGGNFFMTASYSFISVFHFQPYSSGSGNSGDSICADFHCRAVKCARRTFSCNASYLGGIFCDSDCF